jgi:mannosyltransferase OCH1-like enzyme
MIPKKIHYCWFGQSEKPKLVKLCIKSWKKNLPEYEIKEWNENNIPQDSVILKNFLKRKKWAFASDYMRLAAIYREGGIYLDTDFEVIKDITNLLNVSAFLGYEEENRPTNGICGGEKGHIFFKDAINIIESRFHKKMPYLIAPELCIYALSRKSYNLKIYPQDYFYPYNPYSKKEDKKYPLYSRMKLAYACHHWQKSWNKNLFSRAYKKILGRI